MRSTKKLRQEHMLMNGGVSTADFQPRHIFPPGQTLPNVS